MFNAITMFEMDTNYYAYAMDVCNDHNTKLIYDDTRDAYAMLGNYNAIKNALNELFEDTNDFDILPQYFN